MFHLALHVLFDFVVASWHAGCLQQCFSTPFSSMFLTLDLFFCFVRTLQHSLGIS